MMQKRGAFLTLGMTFLSILILALGSAVLKNAEDSESRIYELGSMNRLFQLEHSIQTSYRDIFFGIFGITLANNQTEHTLNIPLPGASLTMADRAFVDYDTYHNFTEEFFINLYPNFNFTSVKTASETFYSLVTNSTAFFIPEINISYVYAHVVTPMTYHLPSSLPGYSNMLILYTNFTQQLGPIDHYTVRLYSNYSNSSITWATYTPGPFNLTVEHYGPASNSSESRLITFVPTFVGQLAQQITLNMSTQPWPLIGVGIASGGPFVNQGYLFVAPYGYNFTMNLSVTYTSPLPRNITMYSYDTFNLSSKDLRIGKATNYRLL